MTKDIIKELDLIYDNHKKDLDNILINHRFEQSKKSYKREFEQFSKELIKKQVELNKSNDIETDKHIIILQNKSKSIYQNFLDFYQ
ncbi:hypothetical protein [Yeosuana marina]|uniref:hypothetical protein n=1 Tax=Yeosuana marina TaxID=1565536 RepID=UPI00142095E9|nr:hypothetical protein [Yeosuana marina]